MAQIYCVRDFPFKTHYIHSSEQCMARTHSFLGLASDEITVLLSGGGGSFIIPWPETRWMEPRRHRLRGCCPLPLCWAPGINLIKLWSMELLVRRREKSFWALNTPRGNQDYLKGKHNGKKALVVTWETNWYLKTRVLFGGWNNLIQKMFLF